MTLKLHDKIQNTNIYKMLILFYIFFCDSFINCEEIRKTLPFPSIREEVEEITIETTSSESDKNIVSFLVENVKEIFSLTEEPTLLIDEIEDSITPFQTFPNKTMLDRKMKFLKVNALSDNRNTTAQKLPKPQNESSVLHELTIKNELLNLSKDLVLIEKAEKEEKALNSLEQIGTNIFEPKTTTEQSNITSNKRSCIFCNNIEVEHCSNPKNKLIPSIICEQDEDLCYSQHTPFGIVDRGCFNINRNITAYFCGCNLCNYVAISEMPHIFSRKRDWIDNVIEMSRTKRFRKSIFKEMACLKCEVNVTTKTGDILDSANCLEGNIAGLPIQLCAENEVCGVKSVRSEGYMWRGCTSYPLYNYWWELCDTDLCNYDALVSVYDKM